MYFVYSFLMGLAALLSAPYWIIKGLRHGKYLSNLGERLGFSIPELEKLSAQRPGAIWIHAVSVGETLSGVTLAKRLRDAYPHRTLIVSTTTITGHALAKERIPFADAIIYFPLDWVFLLSANFSTPSIPPSSSFSKPKSGLTFFAKPSSRNMPVVFVSGRISEKSFTRFQHYLRRVWFLSEALPRLRSFQRFRIPHADSIRTRTRIRALGAPADRVTVSGNLKYDMELPAPTPLASWLGEESKRRGRWPVIVAGSVVATEEPLSLIAFGVVQGDFPKALLVLAPRKPERFAAAAEFIDESHRKFIRRSELAIPGPGISGNDAGRDIPDDVTVLLLDSIGELASLYQVADGVFVGGSLVPSGGHNILEPAAFGKVPVFGDSMENFAAIAARFLEAGAAIQVDNPEDAGVEWIHLLKDQQKMQRMGNAARQLVESSRGALDRALAEVAKQLGGPAR